MPHVPPSDRMSPEDAIFLYLEKKEMPLHIGCVSIFDGPISLDQFSALVESKLSLIPRYRQRIVVPPLHLGHPTWEYDPDFKLSWHMRELTLKRGTDAEVQAVAGEILSQMMDRSRPLWDITLMHGLRHDRTAVLPRIHHSMADGVGGISLLNLILDPTRKAQPIPKRQPFQAPPLPDPTASLIDALVSWTSEAVERLLLAQAAALNLAHSLTTNEAAAAVQQWLALVPDLITSMDRLPFNAPVKGPRRHIWTDYSLRDIAAIRETLGGTMNDVGLTVVTSAVSRYAQLHGQPVAKRLLRYWVPVNLRRPGDTAVGNRISILPVTAPLDVPQPAELLKVIHDRTQALKRSHILDLISMGAAWLGAAPPPFQAMFGLLGNVLPVPPFHMVCTNVPGPQTPIYLLGRKMLRTYPYVPIGNDMGFCCAMQSYHGRVYVGLSADREVVPDVHRLREFFDQAFADLCEAAGVPRTRRRRPPVKARVEAASAEPAAQAVAEPVRAAG